MSEVLLEKRGQKKLFSFIDGKPKWRENFFVVSWKITSLSIPKLLSLQWLHFLIHQLQTTKETINQQLFASTKENKEGGGNKLCYWKLINAFFLNNFPLSFCSHPQFLLSFSFVLLPSFSTCAGCNSISFGGEKEEKKKNFQCERKKKRKSLKWKLIKENYCRKRLKKSLRNSIKGAFLCWSGVRIRFSFSKFYS